jgi:SRSO17 transposase
MRFTESYSEHFKAKGPEHAKVYLSGLLGTQRRKNMGRIGEDIPGSDYDGLQQFVSDSPWDHREVMRHLAEDAARLLGGHRDSALYIDETSFAKKGEKSVGVQRQYCGRLGKVDNCQVGVFACLGRGERAVLVNYRLHLPESWTQDQDRCARAKVPVEQRKHKTKPQQALEMIREAVEQKLGHQWIGGDEAYGNNHELINGIEQLGQIHLMDVSHDTLVYENKPKGAGKPPGGAQKASQLASKHFEKESRRVTWRESTRGPLTAKIWARRIWQWNSAGKRLRECWLVVRQEADGDFKYSISNAPAETSLERLACMQGQRYFIERTFEDAKSEVGMAHYEVRGWTGWHHHMALCCMALLFCLKERIGYREQFPLLSVRDIVELLAFYLPRKNRHEAHVLASIRARHAARSKDIDRRKKIAKKLPK